MKSMNWLAMAALVAVAGIASAHPHDYILGNDFFSLTEDVDSDGLPDVGGVRFAVGEPIADIDGNIQLNVVDSNLGTAGGFYCQDWNADSVCGDDGTIAGVVEPAERFCGTINLIDSVLVGGVPEYDNTKEALIFVDGPILGTAFTVCGTGAISWSLVGSASHSLG